MTVYTLLLPPDTSLTPHTILPAVSSVREFWWDEDRKEGLMDDLFVPDPVIDQIRDSPSYSTEDEKRIAGLQYYLQTLPWASWGHIAGELWGMEEHTALEEIRQYLPQTHGNYRIT